MITMSELEALELLVKAGKVDARIPWQQAIGQARNYIMRLGRQLEQEREKERTENDE